jgi:hypothetical protein
LLRQTRPSILAQLQLGQELFGVPGIWGTEAFAKLIVNRLYQLQSFRVATVALPKTSQITGGAQLPGARLLMASRLQAVDEQGLDFVGRAAGGQKEASLDAQDFGDGEYSPVSFEIWRASVMTCNAASP